MSNKVSIKGMDKADVLAALYNNTHPQGMGFLHYKPAPMTRDEADEILKAGASFDYLHGRVMKVDLSADEFDPRLYDRDNFPGAAQKAVDSIQAK